MSNIKRSLQAFQKGDDCVKKAEGDCDERKYYKETDG